MISKTEAYLKEEEKESLENRKTDKVREEGKIWEVESWRLGCVWEKDLLLKGAAGEGCTDLYSLKS